MFFHAFFCFDDLQCRAHRISSRMCGSADKSVCETFVHKHRAEIVFVQQSFAGLFFRRFAFAAFYESLNEFFHAFICMRVKNVHAVKRKI